MNIYEHLFSLACLYCAAHIIPALNANGRFYHLGAIPTIWSLFPQHSLSSSPWHTFIQHPLAGKHTDPATQASVFPSVQLQDSSEYLEPRLQYIFSLETDDDDDFFVHGPHRNILTQALIENTRI
jgi:hypothetical protein